MNRNPLHIFLFAVLFLLVFYACEKPEKYSEVPEIKYLKTTVVDTTDTLGNTIKRVRLSFSLVDGDGDIGFNEGDTLSPYESTGNYYYDFLVDLYEYKNGAYSKVDLVAPLYYRLPYIEPQGQNKTLKCTLEVTIDHPNNALSPLAWDTVRYDFFVYDRALNQSNIESTEMLIFNP